MRSVAADDPLDALLRQAAKHQDALIRAWGRKLLAGGPGKAKDRAKSAYDHVIVSAPDAGKSAAQVAGKSAAQVAAAPDTKGGSS
jgi:hypothetical protein